LSKSALDSHSFWKEDCCGGGRRGGFEEEEERGATLLFEGVTIFGEESKEKDMMIGYGDMEKDRREKILERREFPNYLTSG
jgi:hypothetical protein